MKKTYIFFVFALLTVIHVRAQFERGSGTSGDPYRIKTEQHLNSLINNYNGCNQPGKYFVLAANISLYNSVAGVNGWLPTNGKPFCFKGHLDGGGFFISNVWKKDTNNYAGGLFSALESGATIKNLGIELNSKGIEGRYFVGGFVGINRGNITGCYVKGGEVWSSKQPVGVGGFAGENSGVIGYCHANTTVRGKNHIIYSTAMPPGVGGFVGVNKGDIIQAYSLSKVIDYYGGGTFIGLNHRSGVNECYYEDVNPKSMESIGKDLVNQKNNILKKTFQQMHKKASFTGFNFTNIWKIVDDCSYPLLQWQTTPAECNCFASGSGTQNNPYIISAPEHLDCLRSYSGAVGAGVYFKLGSSIWMPQYIIQKYGTNGWIPIEDFRGILDGNQHEIEGLFVKNRQNAGLFASLSSEGEIKNLGLANFNIENCGNVGAMVIQNRGKINWCYTAGSIAGATGENVGGLVGYNSNQIKRCRSYVLIDSEGGYNVGGLVGTNSREISQCYVHGWIMGGTNTGGLVGINESGNVNLNHTYVAVSGNNAGGIIGRAMGSSVAFCYSHGIVMGNYVGGILGKAESGELVYSYTACLIYATGASYAANLIGYAGNVCILPSYYDANANCTYLNPPGAFGNISCYIPYPHNTQQLMTRNTYEWPWSEWRIDENRSYPYFDYEHDGSLWTHFTSLEYYFQYSGVVDINAFFPWYMFGLSGYTSWDDIILNGLHQGVCGMRMYSMDADMSFTKNTNSKNAEKSLTTQIYHGAGDFLKIYPNPTNSIITIETSETDPLISIYDIKGIRIKETSEKTIDLSPYPPGIYIVRVGNKTSKVVKQ